MANPSPGDEKKPSCQRCVDGGFDCQYGTKLSFLDKNAITADASKLGKRQGYSKLRVSLPSSEENAPLVY